MSKKWATSALCHIIHGSFDNCSSPDVPLTFRAASRLYSLAPSRALLAQSVTHSEVLLRAVTDRGDEIRLPCEISLNCVTCCFCCCCASAQINPFSSSWEPQRWFRCFLASDWVFFFQCATLQEGLSCYITALSLHVRVFVREREIEMS